MKQLTERARTDGREIVVVLGIGFVGMVKAVVLAVRHKQYLDLDSGQVVRAVGGPCAIVDCFCILDDARIRRYVELGCEVKGMGRDHIKWIKEAVRRQTG